MKFTDYFLEENDFVFIDKIRAEGHPWSCIAAIGDIIASHNKTLNETGTPILTKNAIIDKNSVILQSSLTVHDDIYLPSHDMFIGKGTFLESGSILKGPLYLGQNCEIRQGAYLRGNVIAGDGSVLGHVTEVKNSILMDNSAAGHFAYIGDSVIGRNVNLGAGVKLANLQFRTRDEIDSNYINEIFLPSETGQIKTGLNKMGAVVGDYSEIGCNSVTSPGAVIGASAWIYPNTTLPKGFYKMGSVIKGKGAELDKIRRRRPPY